jgi:hypothetical protein
MRVLVMLLLSLMLFPVAASADNGDSGIAKVKFSDLKELLLERVFAQKGNEGLEKKYRDIQEDDKNKQKKLMEAVKDGNFNPLDYADEAMFGSREEKKDIEELAKGELIRVIEKLYPNKFKLIMNDTFGDNILYTSVLIPDITPNIRQYLLKEKVQEE